MKMSSPTDPSLFVFLPTSLRKIVSLYIAHPCSNDIKKWQRRKRRVEIFISGFSYSMNQSPSVVTFVSSMGSEIISFFRDGKETMCVEYLSVTSVLNSRMVKCEYQRRNSCYYECYHCREWHHSTDDCKLRLN